MEFASRQPVVKSLQGYDQSERNSQRTDYKVGKDFRVGVVTIDTKILPSGILVP
jgi:hypothetical protein